VTDEDGFDVSFWNLWSGVYIVLHGINMFRCSCFDLSVFSRCMFWEGQVQKKALVSMFIDDCFLRRTLVLIGFLLKL